MINFNAYALYEQILQQVKQDATIHNLAAIVVQPDGFLAVARIGFDKQDKAVWNEQCESFILGAESYEYGLAMMADYDELAPSVCCFAAYSLGSITALRVSGELGQPEFMAASAILPAFLINELSDIHQAVAYISNV